MTFLAKAHPARFKILAFGCCALLLAIFSLSRPIFDVGDAHEYLQMLQAWENHGSPDVRPADARQVGEMLDYPGRPGNYYRPMAGFFPNSANRFYCWHFWLYPLAALPAKLFVGAVGLPPIGAFYWTNLAWVLLALGVLLFKSGLSEPKRWMLAGLATISPLIWYINWLHPEAFCWALALMAVAAFTAQRYAWAALWTALASWQNPQLALVSFYALALAAHAAWKEWQIGQSLPAASVASPASDVASHATPHGAHPITHPGIRRNVRKALMALTATFLAAALCFVPAVFYQWHYGWTNLILREQGFPAVRYMSASKVWSALFDLNQGLLPYVPILLLLAGISLARAFKQRNAKVLGLFAVIMLMIVATTSSPVWISATAGLQRYSVWMLPFWAWLVVEALPDTRLVRGAVITAIGVQALVVASHDGGMDHRENKPWVHLVWNVAPALYNPEFLLFQQKVTGSIRPHINGDFPVFYVAPGGNVTKILTDAAGLRRFGSRFAYVDPLWLRSMRLRHGTRRDWFYLHPPPGAVRAKAGDMFRKYKRAT